MQGQNQTPSSTQPISIGQSSGRGTHEQGNTRNSSFPQNSHNTGSLLSTSTTLVNGPSDVTRDLKRKFLLLCVDRHPHQTELRQIELTATPSDQHLFQLIRQAYLEIRECRADRFSLTHPISINLVKVRTGRVLDSSIC